MTGRILLFQGFYHVSQGVRFKRKFNFEIDYKKRKNYYKNHLKQTLFVVFLPIATNES